MKVYDIWLREGEDVDWLGSVQAESEEAATIMARLMYPVDWSRGERMDVTEDERVRA